MAKKIVALVKLDINELSALQSMIDVYRRYYGSLPPFYQSAKDKINEAHGNIIRRHELEKKEP